MFIDLLFIVFLRQHSAVRYSQLHTEIPLHGGYGAISNIARSLASGRLIGCHGYRGIVSQVLLGSNGNTSGRIRTQDSWSF